MKVFVGIMVKMHRTVKSGNFANFPAFGQLVKVSINRAQADIGHLLAQQAIYVVCRGMDCVLAQGFQNHFPLF